VVINSAVHGLCPNCTGDRSSDCRFWSLATGTFFPHLPKVTGDRSCLKHHFHTFRSNPDASCQEFTCQIIRWPNRPLREFIELPDSGQSGIRLLVPSSGRCLIKIRHGTTVLYVKQPWNPPLVRCNLLPASGIEKPTSDSNFIGLFSSTFPVANFPQHFNFSSLPWLPGSNGQLELVVWVKIFDEPPTLVDSCSLLLSVDFSIGHVNPGN
jgi:hypothetical protein